MNNSMDPMLIAAAVVTVIAALTALLVQGFSAWAQAKERIIAANKLDEIKHTTQKASDNVNGNLSKVQEQLTQSVSNSRALADQLATQAQHSKSLQETIDKLTQIVSASATERTRAADRADTHVAVETAVNGGAVAERLKNIEQQTKAIEKNTAGPK